jgi:hypothetical protein
MAHRGVREARARGKISAEIYSDDRKYALRKSFVKENKNDQI